MSPAQKEQYEDSDRIACWARKVCLYPADLYNQKQEADLWQIAGENLQLIREFKEAQIEPKPALEHLMEEHFLRGLEEECDCTEPFIGLLRDYLEAAPVEKTLINFVLRRLANTTIPRLVSSAKENLGHEPPQKAG
jgi:hypothetical protein